MAVMLTVHPPAKNPYRILAVTGNDGVALFSRDRVEQTIERSRRNFLMDYEGKIGDCSREADLEVLSGNEVERAIGAMEKFKRHFEVDLDLLESLKSARNAEIVPTAQRFMIDPPPPGTQEVTIQVSRRRESM